MKLLNSNRRRGTLFVFFFLLFSLSLVGAVTDTVDVDDVFKQNEIIGYKKPCFNNGTYCSSSAQCNFTVFNPDNSILIDNVNGTNNESFHEVRFAVTNIGVHKVDMVCFDSGRRGADTFYFEVTGSGFNNTTWFYIILLIIFGGAMVLGFSLNDAWIVILGTIPLYFLGIYILFNGIVGIKDMVTTYSIAIVLLGVAGYISIKSGLEVMGG